MAGWEILSGLGEKRRRGGWTGENETTINIRTRRRKKVAGRRWLAAGFFLAGIVFFAVPVGAAPWGGLGTVDEPYLIGGAGDMQAIGADSSWWDKHFKLVADIDLGGFSGEQFNIIGSEADPFIGDFNGNGHIIRNFTYTTTGSGPVGLFGRVGGERQASDVYDLGLEEVRIDAPNAEHAGAIAGRLGSGFGPSVRIERCYATGSVAGGANVGGLAGKMDFGSYINDSYSVVEVSGTGGNAGGIVGEKVGPAYKGPGCSIRRSYAAGAVSGGGSSGGIAGYAPCSGYPGGCTTGIYSCVYDRDSCGVDACSGNLPGDCGSKTTAEMVMEDTFTDLEWDFADVWMMWRNSRPHLAWEANTNYDGGDGTADRPYEIRTAAQLNAIGMRTHHWDAHFVLTADIDLSTPAASQAEFNIIGHYVGPEDPCNLPFNGGFDGNGHAISNLVYESSQAHGAGMFAYLGGDGYIRDLRLENSQVHAPNAAYVGLLVGSNSGTISGCLASGSVAGARYVGGLTGANDAGGRISSSCAAADTAGDEYVGGLAGANIFGVISDCFAVGSVTGSGEAGGLVGTNWGVISYCYSAAAVRGSSQGGGLVGGNYSLGFVSSSFWDTQSSGLSVMCGGGNGSGCEDGSGKTTARMMRSDTFIDAGWDFVGERINGMGDKWKMTCEQMNYPMLSWWQVRPGDFVCPDRVDFRDFAFLARYWLKSYCPNDCAPADLDGDGTVDSDDLVVLLDNWLGGL